LLRARSSRFSTRRISWGVRVLCGVLAVAWLLHAPGLAAKQKAPTTETVSGLVTDKAENRISGATVTLKDLQTGKTVAIYTEANGQYQFSDLDPHHDYQIQASFQGVASETRQVSSLDTRRKLVINLTISTGQNKDQAVADKLATLLNWEPGSVVADIGAGEGRLTLAAAQRVGSSGHVFTTELDPRLLVNLQGLAARQKVQNITVIKAGEAQTNLPRECCDSIFMRHVYHHFTQPAQEDASLLQSLKPGGILAVIDFLPSQDASTLESGNEDVPNNRGGHGVTKQALIDELSAAGFQVVTTPTDWPGVDYCIVFRKPPQ
jgi:ubiquinone/menaquinone biosynthesis C-methylase UbiE